MNILIANWTWYPSGGDWTTIENLIKLYEAKGHSVIPFAMQDERNYETSYQQYFVSNIDYRELNRRKNVWNGLNVVGRAIYSFEAKTKLTRLLEDHRIDVAHLHNIGPQITPSILHVLKSRRIPVVWTLHDFGLVCPQGSFFSNGRICEKCRGGKFWQCTLHRCKKNSYAASFIASVRNYVYRLINIQHLVDVFICPSRFQFDKFVEFGFNRKKLKQIYNPYEIPAHLSMSNESNDPVKKIIYVGRIEEEKGILTLINAVRELNDLQLVLIGDGTRLEDYKRFVEQNGLHNVVFNGKKQKSEVAQFISGSFSTVCPSELYENFPYSVVESMAFGKAVVGSHIGGIPELVQDYSTGLTFEPGNVRDLRDKIVYFVKNPDKVLVYGQNARAHVSSLVNFESHYQQMELIFREIGVG